MSDDAARLDVTPIHFTRICREITGRTALALINEVLMAEARRRLVDTDDSAAKIARDLGYSSPAYFTRAFGQETGTTPTGYREQKKGQWHSTRHR
ncbi:helix-turn-helix domain-containing protein [Rhodobacterales bacterium HKCCD6035]|nr:helix-turn-helix domain-containing protein [Rhodobacterales bacterium HKCCD6035]